MIDGDEADDKILAVLDGDRFWAEARDLDGIPELLVERLQHYFLTYKMVPERELEVRIDTVYGAEHARKVVEASMADYEEAFG